MKSYTYRPGQSLMEFVKNHYFAKFPDQTEEEFEANWALYEKLPAFGASENIYEVLANDRNQYKLDYSDEEWNYIKADPIKPEVHWIMRTCTQYHLTKAFEAMKVNLQDPNIAEQQLNKGTPGRIAKLWVGQDPDDTTELGSGRWNREPTLSVFPNEAGTDSIIVKKVDVVSNCSHHFLPFSTLDGGKAIIAYKPKEKILGISKLQRYVTWCARRFFLQESLTEYLGKTIQKIAKTEDVYIRLEGIVHGCEKFRGTNTKNGSLDTEFRGGYFKTHDIIL